MNQDVSCIVLLVKSSYLACCQSGVGEQPRKILPLISRSIYCIKKTIQVMPQFFRQYSINCLLSCCF